jgi:hypothetical protein
MLASIHPLCKDFPEKTLPPGNTFGTAAGGFRFPSKIHIDIP